MSQLARIYALLEDADPGLLQHVQERVNELLIGRNPDGQGTSGNTDTPAAHDKENREAAEYQALQDDMTPEERVADSPASPLSTVRQELEQAEATKDDESTAAVKQNQPEGTEEVKS